jgi:hypothetical protein
MKTKLVLAALAAVIWTAPAAAVGITDTAQIAGTWCLVSSAVNGCDNFEHRYIPRTYIYARKADCEPEDRLVIGPRGLKEYSNDAELSDDGKTLTIEGPLMRKRKITARNTARIVGTWCLTDSIRNGHDTATGAFIPPHNIYRRGSDCERELLQIAPAKHGYRNKITLSDDGQELTVEGDLEKRKERKAR